MAIPTRPRRTAGRRSDGRPVDRHGDGRRHHGPVHLEEAWEPAEQPKLWYEAAGLSSHLDKLVGEHIAA